MSDSVHFVPAGDANSVTTQAPDGSLIVIGAKGFTTKDPAVIVALDGESSVERSKSKPGKAGEEA
jgi:hypothetical protein